MALAGQLLKATTDISRFTVDLTEAATYVQAGAYYTGEYGQVAWLGTEVAVRTVAPTVTLGNTSFSLYPPPNVPPADPTPLLIQSYTFLAGSQQLQFLAYSGTPGNTYTVEFVISDNAGRVLTCDITVIITGNLAIPAPLVPGPTQGALSILGGTMLGPLLLFRDPILSTEAATKHYADNILAGGITTNTQLVVTAGGASITGNVAVMGTLSSTGALLVSSGGAAITGNSTVVGTLSSGANTITSGGLTATGNGSFTGTLSSGGALTVSSGGAAITGNTSVTGTLTSSGALTVSSGGAAITGNTSVTGTLTSSGALTVSSGGATVAGGLTVASGLTVSTGGLVVTAGGLDIVASGATIVGTVTLTGNATVSGSLAVAGAFSGALRDYIAGLVTQYGSSTTIQVNSGFCSDSTNAVAMALASTTTKSTAGTWVAGSGNNGMGVGLTVADNTTYYIFVVQVSGAIDVYFDTSITAANKPTGTTAFRRIGCFQTQGAALIVSYYQVDDAFYFTTPSNIANPITPGATTSSLLSTEIPAGLTMPCIFSLAYGDGSSASQIYVSSPGVNDTSASLGGTFTLACLQNQQTAGIFTAVTDVSSRLRVRVSSTTGSYYWTTIGWIDTRGKNA